MDRGRTAFGLIAKYIRVSNRRWWRGLRIVFGLSGTIACASRAPATRVIVTVCGKFYFATFLDSTIGRRLRAKFEFDVLASGSNMQRTIAS